MTAEELPDFNVNAFVAVAEELVRHDEVRKALDFLDKCMPSYYLDHPPKEIIAIKREILSRWATTSYLVSSAAGCTIGPENCDWLEGTLRGQMLLMDLDKLNSKSIIPHIVDFGCGDFSLPLMLMKHKAKFTYRPICINQEALAMGLPFVKDVMCEDPLDRLIIFVATEIIEHLFDEREILAEVVRCKKLPEVLHFSTPKYSYNTTIRNWRETPDLGHLVAMSPVEFFAAIKRMFPDYEQQFYDSKILHARLEKK